MGIVLVVPLNATTREPFPSLSTFRKHTFCPFPFDPAWMLRSSHPRPKTPNSPTPQKPQPHLWSDFLLLTRVRLSLRRIRYGYRDRPLASSLASLAVGNRTWSGLGSLTICSLPWPRANKITYTTTFTIHMPAGWATTHHPRHFHLP